jgi:hypothetical protein
MRGSGALDIDEASHQLQSLFHSPYARSISRWPDPWPSQTRNAYPLAWIPPGAPIFLARWCPQDCRHELNRPGLLGEFRPLGQSDHRTRQYLVRRIRVLYVSPPVEYPDTWRSRSISWHQTYHNILACAQMPPHRPHCRLMLRLAGRCYPD